MVHFPNNTIHGYIIKKLKDVFMGVLIADSEVCNHLNLAYSRTYGTNRNGLDYD